MIRRLADREKGMAPMGINASSASEPITPMAHIEANLARVSPIDRLHEAYGVHLDEHTNAVIDMTLTSAACPLTDVIADQTESAL